MKSTDIPPLVSFVTWNRMGLSVMNLAEMLKSDDEFELHIVDNNSSDDTWEFIQSLNDSRIKFKIRFDVNRGHIYATNYILSMRKDDQYFITVDNDVKILTRDWVSKFLQVFREFPEVGVLGAVSKKYFNNYKLPLDKFENANTSYLRIRKGFVEGCCQCLRPEVIQLLGFWSEDNHMGDEELCYRLCNYTSYKAGFIPSIEIDQRQVITCNDCLMKYKCSLYGSSIDCFNVYNMKNISPKVRSYCRERYRADKEEMEAGIKSVYSTSVHDTRLQGKIRFNRRKAEENFRFYIEHAN